MIAQIPNAAELFEGLMLICFGVSWPVSIIKTLKVRRVEGKSLIFLMLVALGYIAGCAAKFIESAQTGEPLPAVTWLYVLNGSMVFVDAALYRHFSRLPKAEL